MRAHRYPRLSPFKNVLFSTVLFVLLACTTLLQAQQSGRISGTVLDKTSGDPLPGANVFLEGTTIGSSTNLNGEFVIPRVPPGNYNLIVKFIGYKDASVPVNINAGDRATQTVELEFAAITGEEVTITAQAEGQMAAINQQISSRTITNVVSAEKIQDIPDANAAESVGRLPGISIVRDGGEGQKVTIRGLSPKYNVMMVNGVRMQSTDRDDRSVDLNMISPNILSGIEVTKALTADMDADAVGGMVNLKIGKAAEGFHSKFSFQDGYGSLGDTYGNYKITGLVSNRYMNNKLGVQLSANIDDFNRDSDVLSAGYALNEEAILDKGLIPVDLASATISDKVTDRRRIGGGLVLDYKFNNGSLLFNNFISNLNEKQVEQQNTLWTEGNQWGAFAADRELSNTVLSNALQGEFEFFSVGMDFSLSNSISKQYRPGDLTMNIGMKQGRAGFSAPTLDDPLLATPSELLNAAEVIGLVYDTQGNIEDDYKRISRLYTLERDVTEAAQDAVLNFSIPFNLTNYLSGNLKFGGKYVHNSRDNDETQRYNQPDRVQFGEEFVIIMADSLWPDLGLENFDSNLGIRAFLFEDPDYDIGDFLAGKEGIEDFFYKASIDKMRHWEQLAMDWERLDSTHVSYPLDAQASNQYDYNYKRNLAAFYFMTELNVGNYVTLYPGIRYEDFAIDYTAFLTEKYGPNPDQFRNSELKSNETKGENWFPQLQLRIKPTNWLDVRLASTKSIIYPDYRSVSPYIYYSSYSDPFFTLGNPALKPALSQNFDVYTSVYENHIGLLTAGYFFKEIDNLIVGYNFRTKDSEKINNRFELPQSATSTINTWINLDETSTVKGFELDWQTNFWYLPKHFRGLVFNINYTHITSETTYPFQTSVKVGTGPFAKTVFVDSTRTGRMPNQPDDILNVTLGYDIGGLSTRLSYLYQDNVLVSAHSTYDELDSYTGAYKRWDLTVFQKLPWDGLKLYMNVNNITNRPDRSLVSIRELLSSANYYGRTADLGIRYDF